jgi:hypothetical protein
MVETDILAARRLCWHTATDDKTTQRIKALVTELEQKLREIDAYPTRSPS